MKTYPIVLEIIAKECEWFYETIMYDQVHPDDLYNWYEDFADCVKFFKQTDNSYASKYSEMLDECYDHLFGNR